MTRRRIIVASAALLLALGGVGAWYGLIHKAPPPKPVDERSYDQIDRGEYETWMQELGYTE